MRLKNRPNGSYEILINRIDLTRCAYSYKFYEASWKSVQIKSGVWLNVFAQLLIVQDSVAFVYCLNACKLIHRYVYLCFVQYGGEEHLEAPAKELLLAQTVSTVIALPALAKARPHHTPQRMGETIPSLTQIYILQEQYVEYSRTGRVVKGA